MKDKSSRTYSKQYKQTAPSPEFVDVNGELPRYSPSFEESANYSTFQQSHEQNSPTFEHETNNSGASQLDMMSRTEFTKDELTMCQKGTKETCSSGNNNLTVKSKTDSGLLAKFFSNPTLVTKIFQDQRVIMKIMTNTDMITCLAADPHVSQLLEENSAVLTADGRDHDEKPISQSREVMTLRSNNNSANRQIVKSKESHVKNPILTDLITNRNTEECKNQNFEPGTSADWTKNTADVTRDVLQDVQR